MQFMLIPAAKVYKIYSTEIPSTKHRGAYLKKLPERCDA